MSLTSKEIQTHTKKTSLCDDEKSLGSRFKKDFLNYQWEEITL